MSIAYQSLLGLSELDVDAINANSVNAINVNVTNIYTQNYTGANLYSASGTFNSISVNSLTGGTGYFNNLVFNSFTGANIYANTGYFTDINVSRNINMTAPSISNGLFSYNASQANGGVLLDANYGNLRFKGGNLANFWTIYDNNTYPCLEVANNGPAGPVVINNGGILATTGTFSNVSVNTNATVGASIFMNGQSNATGIFSYNAKQSNGGIMIDQNYGNTRFIGGNSSNFWNIYDNNSYPCLEVANNGPAGPVVINNGKISGLSFTGNTGSFNYLNAAGSLTGNIGSFNSLSVGSLTGNTGSFNSLGTVSLTGSVGTLTNLTIQNDVTFQNSGYSAIVSTNNSANSNFVFPPGNGVTGYLLNTDGYGNTSWQNTPYVSSQSTGVFYPGTGPTTLTLVSGVSQALMYTSLVTPSLGNSRIICNFMVNISNLSLVGNVYVYALAYDIGGTQCITTAAGGYIGNASVSDYTLITGGGLINQYSNSYTISGVRTYLPSTAVTITLYIYCTNIVNTTCTYGIGEQSNSGVVIWPCIPSLSAYCIPA